MMKPLPCLHPALCKYTFYEKKDLEGEVAGEGGFFAGGGGKENKSQLSHPGLSPHYRHIIFPHCRIIIPSCSQSGTISPWIIDFRLWTETWEGMGSWEMGEGRGEVHRKEGGVGETLILSGKKPGQLLQWSLGRTAMVVHRHRARF